VDGLGFSGAKIKRSLPPAPGAKPRTRPNPQSPPEAEKGGYLQRREGPWVSRGSWRGSRRDGGQSPPVVSGAYHAQVDFPRFRFSVGCQPMKPESSGSKKKMSKREWQSMKWNYAGLYRIEIESECSITTNALVGRENCEQRGKIAAVISALNHFYLFFNKLR